MATYKVPQDVEAEDKLIGPFSFRQFIYLIIAALAGFLAYILGRAFWALGIIPAPIVLFFLILALPLKKDQPMETYLTAVVRFFLKPRIRLWEPEGNVSLVEITAAPTSDGPALKDFTGQQASERLRYLSQVVDTGGWSTRGLTSPLDNLSVNDTIAAEAQTAEDIMDNTGSVAQSFDTMISESDQARRQAMYQTMQDSLQKQATAQAQPVSSAPSSSTPPQRPPQQTNVSSNDNSSQGISFNPYPSSIHQHVVDPRGNSAIPAKPDLQKQPQASSEEPVSPDIMRLATSKDLSISTIAREAERLQKKHLEDEEVVVSLR